MHSRGFSLVELSIVLVILGLLTGGILAGQSLIRASELRALSSEIQRFQAATNTFRDKYFAIPGDFRDATRFWGLQIVGSGCTSNSGIAAASAPGACDGNGNGIVPVIGTADTSGEPFQLWRHLQLAGLIEGTYTGLSGSVGGLDATQGSNIPASRISNGGWLAYTFGVQPGNGSVYGMDYGNSFNFGARTASGTVFSRAPTLLRPEEMWNLDIKMDDGRPAYGNIIAYPWGTAASDNRCTLNAADETDLDSDYNLALNAQVCAFYVRNAF